MRVIWTKREVATKQALTKNIREKWHIIFILIILLYDSEHKCTPTFWQSARPSISGYLPYRRTESMKRRFTEVWRTAD